MMELLAILFINNLFGLMYLKITATSHRRGVFSQLDYSVLSQPNVTTKYFEIILPSFENFHLLLEFSRSATAVL